MTLAQIVSNTPIPMLPSPPPAAYYVLENPWPLAIVLGIMAFPAFALLNARRRFKLAPLLAGGLFVCALVVITAAWLVTTEREVLRGCTKELVEFTAAARTVALAPMLTDGAAVSAFGNVIPRPRGKEAILGEVQRTLGEAFPLEEHSIGEVQAHVDGENVARTQVRVWVKFKKDQRMYDAAIGAWFRLDWQRDPDASGGWGPWKVTRIMVMQVDGLGANPNIE